MFKKLETELKLRGFSKMTIESNILHKELFIKFIKKEPNDVIEDDIKLYLTDQISTQKSSPKTIALKKAALKFFYD